MIAWEWVGSSDKPEGVAVIDLTPTTAIELDFGNFEEAHRVVKALEEFEKTARAHEMHRTLDYLQFKTSELRIGAR